MKSTDFSVERASWRVRLNIAFALMSIIPLLTLGYLVVTYIQPGIATQENLLVVVGLNLALSVGGLVIVARMLRSMTVFHRAIEDIARGNLPEDTEIPHSETGIAGSIRLILGRLRQDRELQKQFSYGLEGAVAEKTAELQNALRILKEELERRVTAEQGLKDANMRLSQTLTRLKTVQQKVVQAQRLDALQQMVRGLAHDLNNAFMPLIGLNDYLLRNPEALDNREETLATLREMRESGEHARQIVRSLRDFYRPLDTAERWAVNVSEVVRKTVSLTMPFWRQQKSAAGVKIEVKTDLQDIPPILANESGLADVMTNLIMNACDAMEQGGAISIATRLDGGWIVVEVADTGCGMSEEVKTRCIEPFFTTKGPQRMGLGLSAVHGYVQRHGGTLEIESEPGAGTHIAIRLPVGGVPAEEEEAASGDRPCSRALRVLVIDDDITSVKFVRFSLVREGHSVEVAGSGQEGLAMFAASGFDLVITDRAMPDMRGDDVALAVKTIRPECAVILLTGFGDAMLADGEHPAGVDMILGKPVSDGELCAAVAKIANRSTGYAEERKE